MSKPETTDCPQCGEPAELFCEGVCVPCCDENQVALDQHNAAYDRWECLTDCQRDDEIRRACHAA